MQRLFPVSDVRLFAPGADGHVSDNGQSVYDVVAASFPYYLPTTTLDHQGFEIPTCLAVPDLQAVIPAFRIVPQDTLLANFTATGSGWEDNAFLCWAPRNSLANWNAEGTLAGLVSKYDVPADPDLNFQFSLGDSLSRYGLTEPYTFLSWGAQEYAVRLTYENKATLYRSRSGAWESLGDFDWQTRSLSTWGGAFKQDVFDLLVLFRRGRLMVSVDGGANFLIYADPAGPVTTAPGPVHFAHVGSICSFVQHQVEVVAVSGFDSSLLPLFENRDGSIPGNSTRNGWHYDAPAGTSVEVRRLSTWPGNPAKLAYRATLTAADCTPPGAPFTFWRSPALMAVEFEWPVVTTAPRPADYVSLTDLGLVDSLTVTLPEESGSETAIVNLLLDPQVENYSEYRDRYVEIDLGFRLADDSNELTGVFAGRISDPGIVQTPDFELGLGQTLSLINDSWAAKIVRVDESWPPLDGNGVNAMLSWVAAKCGIPTSRLSWWPTTAQLSQGVPEKPLWWRTDLLPLGTSGWQVLQLIAAYAGMELLVSGDGIWQTFPADTVTGTVHVFDNGAAPADLTRVVRGLQLEQSALDSYTGSIAVGEDEQGRPVGAWKINFACESDEAAVPFVGRRVWSRLDSKSVRAQADAARAVTTDYDQQQRLSDRVSFGTRGQPALLRRDGAQVLNGEAAGVSPASIFTIKQVEHTWGATNKATATTLTAALRE